MRQQSNITVGRDRKGEAGAWKGLDRDCVEGDFEASDIGIYLEDSS